MRIREILTLSWSRSLHYMPSWSDRLTQWPDSQIKALALELTSRLLMCAIKFCSTFTEATSAALWEHRSYRTRYGLKMVSTAMSPTSITRREQRTWATNNFLSPPQTKTHDKSTKQLSVTTSTARISRLLQFSSVHFPRLWRVSSFNSTTNYRLATLHSN